jgi:predicted alpha/beta hydrolase
MSDGQPVTIATRDGWSLAATVYHAAPAAPRRVAVIAPAIGAARGRYASFASYLARAGWTAIAFDYRGIGGSATPGRGASPPTLLAWGEEDLAAVIAWVDTQLGAERITLVAHSIAGQLFALAPNHGRFSAVLAISTPRHCWWLFRVPYRYLLYLFFRAIVPALVAVFGRLPLRVAGLHDLPSGVARDWARASLTAHGADRTSRRIRAAFARYRAPTMLLSFADDRYIAPRRAVDELVRTHYASASCVHCHIDPIAHDLRRIGHSGFFDGRVPTDWWRLAAQWLLEPAAAC